MAIFGYGRVSTTDQTTENQRLEIGRAGYTVEYWFAATSGSAHAAQPAQFRKLFDKLREGDTLVVSKLDRLGRDAPDVLATIKRLAALGVEVIVLQLGKLDPASPGDKLMLALVAGMERDLFVERTEAGMARQGTRPDDQGRLRQVSGISRREGHSRAQQQVAFANVR